MIFKLPVVPMLVLIAVVIWTGILLHSALSTAEDDAAIMGTLGRQRMLSQAMAKALLGYDAAINLVEEQKSNIKTLDHYITSIRKLYTKTVISTAKKNSITLSMTPETDKHSSMPFPATFMRMVYLDSIANSDLSIDIISEFPINQSSALQTSLDMKANKILKEDKSNLYMEVEEIDNKIFLTFYSKDLATDQMCAECHTTMEGRSYELGDMLGIRRYRLPFATSIASVQRFLNPSLDEYEMARNIFSETLNAIQFGGKYPENYNRKSYKEISAITDPQAQKIMDDIRVIFESFEQSAVELIARKGGREGEYKLGQLANELLRESHLLVERYRVIAEDTQNSIKTNVIFSTIILILAIIVIFIIIYREVSEQIRLKQKIEQAEEQLRRTQKMDAIGQLTGGVAHDFNNILCIILGNIELFQLHIKTDEKANKIIKTIRKSAERAAKITTKLLNFSRNQAIETDSININQTLNEMEDMIARSLTPEIQIKYNLEDDLWQVVLNKGDFGDTLINLVLNARDALSGVGTITLETRNCIINDDDDHIFNPEIGTGEYVVFSVSDSGMGISNDDQQRIFDPFFTTKESEQGTGLGLAMVYGFTKRTGGFIKVDSEPGIGTTLQLFLPRATMQDNVIDKSEHHEIALPRGSETILVVDDEEDLQQLVKTQLESLGYRILIASNANQAIFILAEEPDIDLLLTDVVMPGGKNGFELAEKATTIYPDIKVLIISGYAGKTIINDNQEEFKDNLINKPFTKTELAHRVRILLNAQ